MVQYSTQSTEVTHHSITPSLRVQIMKESPKLWDWVVKYGQFEPRNDEETDQQRRRRRQNTFAPELPQGFAAQHGGLAALRNRMKTLA